MFDVCEFIYNKVEESNFCLGNDSGGKESNDSKFLNLSPQAAPIIPVRSHFDECEDDYETDLSFVLEES